MTDFTYPAMIASLPEADINQPGVTARLLQAEGKQIVFFDIEPIGQIPMHSHGAQWGIVVEGELNLTIGSETRLYTKGDSYFIPAGVPHGATVLSRVKVIDVFDQADRYKPKGQK